MAASTRTRTAPLIPTGRWRIDAAHSSVRFSVKHMGIANVRGKFSEFEGTLEMKESLADCRAFGTVKVASIDTGEPQRDDHLRSPDFLDVDVHPVITFTSTGLRQRGADSWTLLGELTLHGEHRQIELELTYGGWGPDPWGGVRAAFHAETTLHRNDFAINYSAMVRAGVAAVGTTVKIELDVEAVQGETLPQF